ncbi:MAG: hypothetical protein HY529_05240 [Chloroflexi bacterium]|nr:hypothetical protein [Chloroflexota bacterium]
MTNQIKIFFDMLAGILAGMEILVPKSIYKKIDEYLLGELQDTVTRRGSLRWLWIIGAIILTMVVILMLEFSAFTKDIGNGRILETVALILGFLVGMIILAIVIRFYRLITSLRSINPTQFAIIAGFVLGVVSWIIATLLAGRSTSHSTILAVSFLIAFSASITIMGLLVGIMPLAKRFLTFQSGVLLRIGIILFIVARIIELRIG